MPEKSESKGEAPKPVEIVVESESAALLVMGLFLLGTVLGGVTGGSVAEGISTTLLSSLLTFVAGAVLTFSGFRVQRRATEPVRVSPARLGAAVTALSLGVWVGIGAGVYAKIRWMQWRDHVDAAASAADANEKVKREKVGPPGPAPSGSNASIGGSAAAIPVQALAQPIILQVPCPEAKAKAAPKAGSGPLQNDPN